MNLNLVRASALAATVAALLWAAACTSPTGETYVVDTDASKPIPQAELRPLPASFAGQKSVAYSGYRLSTNADASAPTQDNIDQDLDLLVGQGFKVLRLFGSDDIFSKKVIQTIHNRTLPLKVQLGVWISGSRASYDEANQAEIRRGIALAQTYPDVVAAVSVGNEKMVDWNTWGPCPAIDMLAYIHQVRKAITQPVTTDDNWAVFANDQAKYPTTATLLKVIDYVAVHSYPIADAKYNLWNWKQLNGDGTASLGAEAMMDAAIAKTKADYQAVRDNMNTLGLTYVPIIIGETGWKAVVTDGEKFLAHPVNQKMYYDRLAAWTDGPSNVVYFEAFDEPWKQGDDGWGLWDVNRQPRYVLTGTGYTAADALKYIPPVSNGTITKNTYLIYADTLTANADTAIPSDPDVVEWMGWNNPWTADFAVGTGSEGTPEGTQTLVITPKPASWGWGAFLNNPNPEDLTNFQASGHLRFAIKTTYPHRFEVGFLTTDDSGLSDCYVPMASGSYNFVNDGQWHQVSIPIATIAAAHVPAYGQPATAKLNLGLVTNPFVLADRYSASTGQDQSKVTIEVDQIRWTRD